MVVFWGPLFGADYCLAMFLTRYRDPLGYAGHPDRSDFSTTDKIVCPWYRQPPNEITRNARQGSAGCTIMRLDDKDGNDADCDGSV
jgi:hypothetical protein